MVRKPHQRATTERSARPTARTLFSNDKETQFDLVLSRVKVAVENLEDILAISENNKYLLYSEGISKNIPRSIGAHAFKNLQHSNLRYLLIRLIALWDGTGDTNGLSDIRKNITADIKQRALANRISEYDNHDRHLIDDQGERVDKSNYVNKSAKDHRDRSAGRIEFAMERIPIVLGDQRYRSIKELRDKYIAHSADMNLDERPQKPKPMKLGNEEWLIDESIDVVEALYFGINGVGFDIREARTIFENRARSFWQNVDFSKVQ